jgi:ABC-type dipeptide/oligopeptide/nickel transport system permease subunit
VNGRGAARALALGWLCALPLVAVLARWFGAGGDPALLQSRLTSLPSAPGLFAWWACATLDTLGIVAAATLLATLLGGALGASGVYGDTGSLGLLLRLVEFLGAVPSLILVGILRLADPSGGVLGLLATLTLLRTLEVAQLVRAHVLATLPSDFVEASRALGGSRRWQLRVHVLPRLLQPLGTNLLLGASTLIGLEAALSFTGLGLPARVPSWGGGLAALAAAGSNPARWLVVLSIGASCTALYVLAALLERRRGRGPTFAASEAQALRDLGAEGQGS